MLFIGQISTGIVPNLRVENLSKNLLSLVFQGFAAFDKKFSIAKYASIRSMRTTINGRRLALLIRRTVCPSLKGGGAMVTYSDLIQIGILITSLFSVILMLIIFILEYKKQPPQSK